MDTNVPGVKTTVTPPAICDELICMLTPGIDTHTPFCGGRTEQHYHESPSLKIHDSNYI